MYQVIYKKTTDKNYKPFRERKFRTYEKAYYTIGNTLQVKDTLSWGYNLKYMFDGYNKTKLLKYGNTYFRRKNYHFKIINLKK